MDIQSQDESNNQQLDVEPLALRTLKKLVLSNQAESIAYNITSKRNKNIEFNRFLDPNNVGSRYNLSLRTKQFGQFEHFLTKNKNRDEKSEVLDVIRELAQQRNIELNGRIKDKLQKSRMIVRVINKQQASGQVVIIQDQTGKQKMQVKNGTIWIGMIACMDLSWVDGCYKLELVHDLSLKFQNFNKNSLLKQPFSAYRIIFVKGSFSKLDSKQNIGLKIIIDQLKLMKQKQRIKVDSIVIFGPLLNRKNTILKNSFSQLTFEQQAKQLIKVIKDEISKISDQINIVFVPSTDDLTNYYPMPQPKYNRDANFDADNIYYTSNPGIIQLHGAKQSYQINAINYDILQYIDQSRIGKPINQIMQDNLESYFKQPFYIANTLNEPFDQTNLPGVYNSGKFGHIIVTSSHRDPPFAREIKGRVYVNIGSLGIDEPNLTAKHYLTLLSIYDGQGPTSQRIKVESLSM